MNCSEYQILASRTCKHLSSKERDARHMLMGVITEVGEIVDVYKKNLAYNKPIDEVNLSEEWADVAWYIANEANRHSFTLTDVSEFVSIDYITSGFFRNDIEIILLDFINIFKDVQKKAILTDYGKIAANMNLDVSFSYWVYIGRCLLLVDTDKALQNNIAKLKARYPNSFTEHDALNRDLDAERKELEK